MPALLYYSRIAASGYSATTSASGYSASNAGLYAIARPWRSTSTAANDLQANFSLQTLRGVMVQDTNIASPSVYSIASGGGSVLLSSPGTPPQEPNGRRKILVACNVMAQGCKISAASGTPTDGASYHSVGALYAWGAVMSLLCDPLLGSSVRRVRPRVQADLENGQRADAKTGPAFADRILLRFRVQAGQDLEAIERLADAGVCGLDLGIANRRDLAWPVVCTARSIERAMSRANQDDVELEFMEVVA